MPRGLETGNLDKLIREDQGNKFYTLFPDTGPLRRELYVKHTEFFRASKEHDQILFLAANRVGKTVAGSYLATCFSTGVYPDWWEGRVFNRPTVGWACNKTAVDTRDINQFELLGQPGQLGTGIIPRDYIIHTKSKPSVPDAVEIAYIRHKSNIGQSCIFFKSYDQGREKFQGRAIDWIWFDEEVPMEVYSEAVMRIMTTGGIILCTYTPIQGLTQVTTMFLRDSVNKASLPFKFAAGSTSAHI